MSIEYTRQEGIITPNILKEAKVTVIGVGAVGSCTALSLAKMGVPIIQVFDKDVVDTHNIPNQYYREKDIGTPKVEALKEIIKEYAGIDIEANNEFYSGQDTHPLVISAVDSMSVRSDIWQKIKQFSNIQYYIDSRMGAEVSEVYTTNPPLDGDAYEYFLWPEEEAVQLPCTARSIIYTASGLGAFLCGKIKKILMSEPINKKLTIDFRTGIMLTNKALQEAIPS